MQSAINELVQLKSETDSIIDEIAGLKQGIADLEIRKADKTSEFIRQATQFLKDIGYPEDQYWWDVFDNGDVIIQEGIKWDGEKLYALMYHSQNKKEEPKVMLALDKAARYEYATNLKDFIGQIVKQKREERDQLLVEHDQLMEDVYEVEEGDEIPF